MVDLVIIGKNGQLGKALVNASEERKLNFKAFNKEELDITDYKKTQQTLKKINPKIIINTSAFHVTVLCDSRPLDAFEVNCVAVKNLAGFARDIGSKFVTYSTNYVFDGKKGSPYFEDDITNPLQMYGLSKLAGEIASLNEYNEGTYVIRTCGVYGGGKKGSRSKKGNYILKVIEEAKKSKEVVASSKQIVNPTFAGDLAAASLNLLEVGPKAGIYHLANEGYCSWYDFAKMIFELKKIKTKLVTIPEDKVLDMKRPLFSALENRKAKDLGIILPSIREGLKEYLKVL